MSTESKPFVPLSIAPAPAANSGHSTTASTAPPPTRLNAWNAGYRGMLNQLGEDKIASFRQEHLAEVEEWVSAGDGALRVEVIDTVGRV